MLLSLSRKFIFVANLKSASSGIENAIGDQAEIRIVQTKFGKHVSLSQISQKFAWVKRYIPYKEFFVFGVIRDPVDFLLSLYNSHQKPAFDGRTHSTKGMSFDDFLEIWCEQSWQATPPHQRFTDEHGRFCMNHLIELEHLGEEFPKICERLELGAVRLGRTNSSPSVLRRLDLTSAQIDRVKARYREDYDLIRDRPRAL